MVTQQFQLLVHRRRRPVVDAGRRRRRERPGTNRGPRSGATPPIQTNGTMMNPRPSYDRPGRRALRRALLLVGSLILLVGVGAPVAHGQPGAPPVTAERPLPLTLPAPSGPARVGVVPVHLVDHSRPGPWVPSQPARELMVSLWYPAQRVHGYPRAPWLPPAPWARF